MSRPRPSGRTNPRTPHTAPAALAAGRQHPELEHVPTVLELAGEGLAEPRPGSTFRITPDGLERIRGAMTRNADRLRADPDLRRRVAIAAIAGSRQNREP